MNINCNKRRKAGQIKLTNAQQRALNWLHERGGSGVLDSRARILAKDEISSFYAPETWLRLFAMGCLIAVNGRVVISSVGDILTGDET